MRQGHNNRRPRGGRGGGHGGGGNGHGGGYGGGGGSGHGGMRGGPRPGVPLRHQTFESNGPDIRVRGNAFQVYEKYLSLARDAASGGDRVMAENYLQHAEHYFRVIQAINEASGQTGGYDPRGQQNRSGAPGQGDQPDLSSGEEGEGEAEAQITRPARPQPPNTSLADPLADDEDGSEPPEDRMAARA